MNWDDHKELKVLKEKLSERFTDPEFLGGGGYGKVFKLIDKKSHKPYAIKVLNLVTLNMLNEEERENVRIRFAKEARGYAVCKHPNLIKITSIENENDFPYLVIEYIDGKNLDKLLDEKGVFSLEEILTVSEAILPAVDYMHKKEFVHRDLKPANIMAEHGTKRRYVVIDFGIVKDLLSPTLTKTGEIVGSSYYMAPEQWESAKKAKSTADIYSLGVMLYKMATGEVPFKGDMKTVMNAHFFAPVPQVKDKNPNAPQGIQEIIEKAMAKKPEDRYQETEDLLKALKGLTSAVT